MPVGAEPLRTAGYVRFPVADPTWTDSGEGGIFVRLFVVEPMERYSRARRWVTCFGGEQWCTEDESLEATYSVRARRFLPNPHLPLGLENAGDHSFGCLAILTIGGTNWSGRLPWPAGELWTCTPADLTPDGMVLLTQMRALYTGCAIYLTTWLDT